MDGSLPSSPAFVQDLASPAPADEVARKLRGGVWEHSELARLGYGALLGVGRFLSARGVTPNVLTYAALLLALGAGIAAALQLHLVAAGLLLLSGLLDLLDGAVARAGHLSSRFGALLDSTVDRVADALSLLGLVIAHAGRPLASAILVLAMLTGFAVSYVRARAEGLGIPLPPLFMRRAERLGLQLLALGVGAISVRGFPSQAAMLSILAVMGVLSLVAAVWALRTAYVAVADEAPRRLSARAAPRPSRP